MSVERPYERMIFVCTTGPWCARDGSVAIHKRMKELAKEEGLKDVRVTKSGCLGQCGHGPMAVVLPENVWYCALEIEGGERIVRDHLAQGRLVPDLRYRAERPGSNKTPEIVELEAKEKAEKA